MKYGGNTSGGNKVEIRGKQRWNSMEIMGPTLEKVWGKYGNKVEKLWK